MAHTLTTQILEQGMKFVVIKVNIKGDGASGELAKEILFDASAYSLKIKNKLCDISYVLNGFSAELFWDATTDVPLLSLAKDFHFKECFIREMGGLRNNAGDGVTGDILISTLGLATKTYDGDIILRVAWRE